MVHFNRMSKVNILAILLLLKKIILEALGGKFVAGSG